MTSLPQRIRVQFSKDGSLRFIGHLDLQRLFERALRRSGLPLRYSQGFNPKVRINIACALPLGFSSDCELVDFWLEEPQPLEEIELRFKNALPGDIRVIGLTEVPAQLPSLQASVNACEYQVRFPDELDGQELRASFSDLLTSTSLPVERKKKTVDIRPLIENWQWQEAGTYPVLHLRLTATPQSTGRPDEIVRLMGLDPAECEIRRVKIDMTDNGNGEDSYEIG